MTPAVARLIDRLAEQSADEHVGAARLVDHGAAKTIMRLAKQSQSVGHRAAAQVGTTLDDDASRLTGCMRINDVNCSCHVWLPLHGVGVHALACRGRLKPGLQQTSDLQDFRQRAIDLRIFESIAMLLSDFRQDAL